MHDVNIMQCPKCGANLSAAKMLALSRGFHCHGCGSHLKVSGLWAMVIAAVFFPVISVSDSWLWFLLSSAVYMGLLVFFFRKFAKVSVVEQ
jgi:hypothetical protein